MRRKYLLAGLVLTGLLAACSPEQAFVPRSTSDALPTPTPEAAKQSSGSQQMTAETGLAVVLEGWAHLVQNDIEAPDPLPLLQAAWDGMENALPAGSDKPAFPDLSTSDPQAALRQFRSAYISAAAPSGGGVEGQADLAYSAVTSMTKSLNDCNTSFQSATDLKQLAARQSSTAQPQGGVGIRIKREGDQAAIVWELLSGGSAGAAGVKPGDAILKVDGKDATQMTIDQLATKIRGPVGSKVLLTVQRADGKRVQDITVKRVALSEPVFQTRTLANNIAYFRLLGFTQNGYAKMLDALRQSATKNPPGWIIDLRANSGGDTRTVLALLSKFLKQGPFAYEVTDQGETSYGPDGSYLNTPVPLVVLVSDATSSGAELFARDIQYYHAGTLVGTKTAGCLGVASRYQLADGSVLSVLTKKILGPDDKPINRVGVTPDEVVEVSRAELAAGKDPQLQKAIALLTPSK